jgi:hypothetical protein
MSTRKITLMFAAMAAFGFALSTSSEAVGQRGGIGKSSGHAAKAAPRPGNSGPAMSRPAGGGGRQPAIKHTNPGASLPKAANRPAAPKFERPAMGNAQPKLGGGVSGKGPIAKSGDRPLAKGPENKLPRPGGGASHNPANDFLGIGDRPSTGVKDKLPGKENRPDLKDKLPGKNSPDFKDKLPGKIDFKGKLPKKDDTPDTKGKLPDLKDKLPKKDNTPDMKGKLPPDLKDKLPKKDNTPDMKGKLPPDLKDKLPKKDNTPDINIGNVNIGNKVDFSKDQTAWINNQHVTGNQVRVNAGNRYAGAYASGAYRRGAVGGYPYYTGWAGRGSYFGWRPVTYATLGTFLGAGWAQAKPVYYAYGTGGNVYYENDTVYVNGTASGTPEQYSEQVLAAVAAAPAKVEDTEWTPLGTFAVTSEGVEDSQSMVELAISKTGIVAGTYYNESTEVSRPLKGTVDPKTQRVSIGFADGQNDNVAFETGLYNLTQEEAPGLLHLGTTETKPELLVRLQPPEEAK